MPPPLLLENSVKQVKVCLSDKCVVERVFAGIPIDMVGGTSMGSFVGAAYAESGDVNKMCQKVREWSMVRACYFVQFLHYYTKVQ